jgi:hypothetical protein
VIHKSSAVSNRCKAVVTLELILMKSKKKIIKYRFTSPKCRTFLNFDVKISILNIAPIEKTVVLN